MRVDRLRARYLRFADEEARGRSPTYERLARAVATSEPLLQFLLSLPEHKRQPNLLLASLRFLGVEAQDADDVERFVALAGDELAQLMRARSTQTNEAARCATLLPLLASLPGPLALIEVGAAAGLCLLPDRYGYRYGTHELRPTESTHDRCPVFDCRADEATPLPHALPEVVWRRGIDLAPLDVADHDDTDWLRAMIWPEHEARRSHLERALHVARADPPEIDCGDLIELLPDVVAEAPPDATLVVFHTAVLAYLTRERRQEFEALVRRQPARWVSNESRGVFPSIDAQLSRDPPPGQFVLSLDGRPLALTDPHGRSVEWLR